MQQVIPPKKQGEAPALNDQPEPENPGTKAPEPEVAQAEPSSAQAVAQVASPNDTLTSTDSVAVGKSSLNANEEQLAMKEVHSPLDWGQDGVFRGRNPEDEIIAKGTGPASIFGTRMVPKPDI